MSSRLRIGFVTTSFPRYSGDAAGSFVFGLARGLARRGHEIQVVVPEPNSTSDWEGAPSWLEGIRVECAPYARPKRAERLFWGDGAPDNLRKNPKLAWLAPLAVGSLFLKTTLLATNWDVAISHWLVPSALAATGVRRMGTSHIAVAHSADVNLLGRLPFNRSLKMAVARSANHLGFVSAALKNEFLCGLPKDEAQRLEGRTSVTPLGIDAAQLVPSKPRQKLRQDLGLNGFCVLFLGRLVPIKGVDLLIEAMKELKGATLVVAGEGSIRASLESRAANCGVDARFMGFVGPKRRADLLAACDAIALPSRILPGGRHEGLPLTLIEAMHSGLPAVVSSTGAMLELIENDITGLSVPPDNVPKLAKTLKRLYKNPKLAHRLALNGKNSVKNRDWTVVLNKWEDLIFRLESSRRRPT